MNYTRFKIIDYVLSSNELVILSIIFFKSLSSKKPEFLKVVIIPVFENSKFKSLKYKFFKILVFHK